MGSKTGPIINIDNIKGVAGKLLSRRNTILYIMPNTW